MGSLLLALAILLAGLVAVVQEVDDQSPVIATEACATPDPSALKVEHSMSDPVPNRLQREDIDCILLLRHGRATAIDRQSQVFDDLAEASDRLLSTADDTYKMLVNEQTVSDVRKGSGLEIRYRLIQQTVIPYNQVTVSYTALVIPLQGRHSSGPVFFRYVNDNSLEGAPVDETTPATGLGVVVNRAGVNVVSSLIASSGW